MQKLKVLGVIPARLGSTRIPEKMLKDLGGKPLIVRTVERTLKAKSLDALIVATDSERIADAVRSLIPVIMTSPELPTGTDRTAAAAEQFSGFTPDIVANIWGDEPLYPADAIDACIKLLDEDSALQVVAGADRIRDEHLISEPSIVKVITDLDNNALAFSRSPIPFPFNLSASYEYYQVIGVMAMRREFLYSYLSLPRTPFELRESVEQMRIIEHGIRMKVVKGDYKNLGVNTPEELEQVRAIFSSAS